MNNVSSAWRGLKLRVGDNDREFRSGNDYVFVLLK